ncbi:MAG: isopentenyl-diphosphate Delta-isomerase [Flavisolibacter sp.]
MEKTMVILVDGHDNQTGIMEKMEVHQKGLLHRAFSIFIFDTHGRMLLQQRAATKYHGGLLWTNACCSHPMPGEETLDAAYRRLEEELGFTTTLEEIFSFVYRAEVENDLVEHEFDHVFAGTYESDIFPNEMEVASYRYETLDQVKQELENHPSHFTTWFGIAFPAIEKWRNEK